MAEFSLSHSYPFQLAETDFLFKYALHIVDNEQHLAASLRPAQAEILISLSLKSKLDICFA